MTNELSIYADGFNIAGAIGSVFSYGSAAAVAGIANTYFTQLSAGLNYYNNNHSHNQIYMDVNWSGGYSFHILA